MIRCSLLLAAFVACLVPARAQDPASPEMNWSHDYATAFARAVAEKKPVLFCIMKDKEIACKRMLETVYHDAGVQLKMKEFVLMPCSTFMHTSVPSDTETKVMPPCPQFRGCTCVEHQSIDREMRKNFQDTSTVIAPQHIIVDPTGKVLARHVFEQKTGEFAAFLDHGLALFADPSKLEAPASRPGDATSRPGGADARPARSAEVERLMALIVKTPEIADKESATKDLMADGANQERQDAFLDVMKLLKASKERGAIVRVLGYPQYAPSSKAIVKLLEDKDTYTRNCAVVTLEEMADQTTAAALIELFAKEKDPEIHKDILRALGPCGGGRPEVKALLVKESGASTDNVRAAVIMSLGYFLAGDADIAKLFKARYAKESGLKMKTAVLWGIALSGDPAQDGLVDALVANENNHDVKTFADGVKKRLNGEDPFAAGGGRPGGGGGGGGGRGGGGGGGRFGVLKMLQPLYADDKIIRNRIKEIRAMMGGGGMGGPGGPNGPTGPGGRGG